MFIDSVVTDEKIDLRELNCYYIAGPEKLWLKRYQVGPSAVYDFDWKMWCFETQESAIDVLGKYVEKKEDYKVQRFFSRIFHTYKNGTRHEKAVLNARSSYEWKRKDVDKLEQSFCVECDRLKMDRSVVEGGMDDQLNDNEMKSILYLREIWNNLQKEQEQCQELNGDYLVIKDSSVAYEEGAIEEAVVQELNKRHAVVHTDRYYILTEKNDPGFGHPSFYLETRSSFRDFYENQEEECSDGKRRTRAAIWLKHSKRRQYEGIVFDPSPQGKNPKHYNIWKGFAMKPKEGNCNLYWDHIFENICSGNKKSYVYLRKWMACVFQNPHKVHTAIAIRGPQGAGKNTFVNPLGTLFGPHFCELSSLEGLLGRFNNHLKSAVLIHANESMYGGERREMGKFKAMITEPSCIIEGKGKDSIQVRNFRHIILSSNEDWLIHLDPDDRRVFVLSVSPKRKNDIDYFEKLHRQLKDQSGYEALLYDLLHEDLDGFDPRRFPVCDDAFEIKLKGASNAASFIYRILKERYKEVLSYKDANLEGSVGTEAFYKEYCRWCTVNSLSCETQRNLGKVLKKILPSVKKKRKRKDDDRKHVYLFLSLKEVRKEFQNTFKSTEKIWELEF